MKDKTKELADSVGAVYPVLFMGRHDGVLFTETELETFVDLVAAAERNIVMNEPLTKAQWQRFEDEIRADEREACAKVCEERGMVKGGEVFSARIRARGTT